MGEVIKFRHRGPCRMEFTREAGSARKTTSQSFIRSPLASACAALLLAGSWLVYKPAPSVDQEVAARFDVCRGGYRHNCVVDGDTVWIGGAKIRLSGIDAPEIGSPACGREAELGHRAKRRLVELMNNGPFEVVRNGWRDSDSYGRKLRQLHRNGRSLGSVLVSEGLARTWPDGPERWCT